MDSFQRGFWLIPETFCSCDEIKFLLTDCMVNAEKRSDVSFLLHSVQSVHHSYILNIFRIDQEIV